MHSGSVAAVSENCDFAMLALPVHATKNMLVSSSGKPRPGHPTGMLACRILPQSQGSTAGLDPGLCALGTNAEIAGA